MVLSAELVILLMVAVLLLLIVLGHPIGFVLGGVATIFGLVFIGNQAMHMFYLRLVSVFQDYTLIAIPLFVFMGIIIEQAGIAEKLYEAVRILMGRLNGGLAITAILTSTIFAAATGVIGASIVTVGILALPSMKKYEYNNSLSTGSICAGGTLGILIPPSILILVYGPTAAISVGALFAAAIIPGLLLSMMYMIYIGVRCKIDPSFGPGMSAEELAQYTTNDKVRLFLTSVVPVAIIILAVLGVIVVGVAAPTEAAAVGALAAMILAAFNKKLTLEGVKEASLRTIKTSCMVYMVLIGANFFTGVFMRLGGGDIVKELVIGLPFPDWGLLLTMWFVIFILGMFIDWIGVIMIAIPLFTPIAAELGYDPIWFAMMNIVLLQTSFLTPPFAYSIFYVKGIAPEGITTVDIYKGVVPFVGIQLVTLVILGAFPQIIMFLPKAFGL
ncbi:TRAP transporter large permease [Natranaerofaba carboxydovora]|uniref:TRAP transporter large permease n=1 Tax=Natranaerofaba carboxydovora TaxID=2742683 RepID=UPI001F12B9E9|nr:TRAP transporter large permease subunit [Natranaerofaba carboxydovora]UMZ72628.1 C4-dicarboxylate TRAP transporter large permease protein DctM [Natranaerofaba carboxydovora]